MTQHKNKVIIKDQIDYQKIFKSTPDMYMVLSKDFVILDVNSSFEKSSMKKRSDIIGHKLFEAFPDNPDDSNANGVSNLSQSLHFVLKEKKPHSMAIQRYDVEKPDGTFEERYWSVINFPVLNSQNEIDCIVQRVKEMTEFMLLKEKNLLTEHKNLSLQEKVKKMEAEIFKHSREIQQMNFELEKKVFDRTETLLKREATLATQNQKLHNQNKELEQFTYIASHDLQEPLRSLTSFTELLSEEFAGKLEGNGSIYIDFISNSSIRMRELVKGLLDYSRIGKEKKTIKVDCNQIVNDVISDMYYSIKESNAKITVENLPVINGYPTELRLLFQNLISNAIKFRKKEVSPEIEIFAKEQNENWLFSIKDNAIGIRETDIKKLFVVFKRLNNRDDYEGTGIGLAQCKKIIELHEGNIWTDSELGKGSVFNFTIPKF
jgi:PAS domain S-box-containing protein